ncbi:MULTISPECIES: hypothetical protein [Haloarcula]|uniref:hypothetical protein n=1 Tax=Haloarcula TaxID=2237 RepID=UPI0023ED9598|nr:hypothetical protein [Halomicroarcula sp. XH51]
MSGQARRRRVAGGDPPGGPATAVSERADTLSGDDERTGTLWGLRASLGVTELRYRA